ncbi:DUF3265 domain-containing protein [Vibrio vulnificus]|nr:DUF3265 domain-containing protein [Vibrio vulnificus]
MSFGGESGLQKLGLCGIHPLTQRYVLRGNMETILISLFSSVTTASVLSLVAYLCRNWLIERLKASIKHEYDVKLENYKSEISRREKAALIAELVAEWTHDRESTKRLNQLLWELSLYLPSNLINDLNATISNDPEHKDIRQVLVEVRGYLLDGNDPLSYEQIRHFKDPANNQMVVNRKPRT